MIFASFGPEMIDLTRSSARAVQELKHYLEFAERGPAALGGGIRPMGGIRNELGRSDFEEYARLEQMKFRRKPAAAVEGPAPVHPPKGSARG